MTARDRIKSLQNYVEVNKHEPVVIEEKENFIPRGKTITF